MGYSGYPQTRRNAAAGYLLDVAYRAIKYAPLPAAKPGEGRSGRLAGEVPFPVADGKVDGGADADDPGRPSGNRRCAMSGCLGPLLTGVGTEFRPQRRDLGLLAGDLPGDTLQTRLVRN